MYVGNVMWKLWNQYIEIFVFVYPGRMWLVDPWRNHRTSRAGQHTGGRRTPK